MCRRWTSGPFIGVISGTQVNFTGGDNIATFQSSQWAERGFCSNCGTHLFYRLKEDGHYAIPVGLLDEGEGWVFDEQIFIDEKPAFYSFSNETKNLTGAEVFAQYLPDGE